MNSFAMSLWKEEEGFLTFEWILLMTLLTIGIVGGLAAVRDATIDELGDVAQAMLSLDQSFTIAPPLEVVVHDFTTSTASDSSFTDAFPFFRHCGRVNFDGQGTHPDCSNNLPAGAN